MFESERLVCVWTRTRLPVVCVSDQSRLIPVTHELLTFSFALALLSECFYSDLSWFAGTVTVTSPVTVSGLVQVQLTSLSVLVLVLTCPRPELRVILDLKLLRLISLPLEVSKEPHVTDQALPVVVVQSV